MGLAAPPIPPSGICPRFGKDQLSKGRAKSLAKILQRRKGQLVEAYVCRACGHWHVGGRRKFS